MHRNQGQRLGFGLVRLMDEHLYILSNAFSHSSYKQAYPTEKRKCSHLRILASLVTSGGRSKSNADADTDWWTYRMVDIAKWPRATLSARWFKSSHDRGRTRFQLVRNFFKLWAWPKGTSKLVINYMNLETIIITTGSKNSQFGHLL